VRQIDADTLKSKVHEVIYGYKPPRIPKWEAIELAQKILQEQAERESPLTIEDHIKSLPTEQFAKFILKCHVEGYLGSSVSGDMDMIDWVKMEYKEDSK